MNKQTKKSILFFAPNLDGGGAEKVSVHLANGFLETGFDVTILLGRREGVYFDLLNSNIKILALDESTLIGYLRKIRGVLKKQHYDYAISFNHYCNAALVVYGKLIDKRVKVIITQHNDLYNRTSWLPILNRLWIRTLYRVVINKADFVIGVSRGVIEGYLKVVNRKQDSYAWIFNPVFDNKIFEKANEELTDISISDKKKILVTIGRLDAGKNHILQLRAMRKLIDGGYDLQLFILGEGVKREFLEGKISELGLENHVFLLGFQKNPYKYLKKADLFLLSSLHEGLPTVIVEALSLGTNVVSTNCPHGPEEILKGDTYGFIADNNDLDSFVRKVKEALTRPIESRLLKQRASTFHRDAIVKSYIEHLLSL